MWLTCKHLRIVSVITAGVWLVASPVPAQEPSAWGEKAKTILDKNCSSCHGASQLSGLDLRQRAAMLRGGRRGPALVPGRAGESLLYLAVSHRGELKMPPGDTSLTATDIEALKRWIDEGAPWPDREAPDPTHWAFRSIQAPAPPEDPTGWSEHPIDRFVIRRLQAHNLRPLGPADKGSLIRRTTFDLIGLPPQPGEVEAFLADDSEEAFSKVVDRLLASPRYGERWGRHWMDVVRYADTAGDNADYPVPETRLYRDYIIDSYNADKPYDRFVREQIAGDILAKQGPADRYAERVIATGFLALSRRYATGPYELWHLTLEDTIETVGRAYLGLTLRCARCHDHKFDPVTTEDYYGLYGIFASTQYPYGGSEEFNSLQENRSGFVPLFPPDQAAPLLRAHQRTIDPLAQRIEQIGKESPRVKEVTETDKKIQGKMDAIERVQEKLHSRYTRPVEKASVQVELASLQQELLKLGKERDESYLQLDRKQRPLVGELQDLRLQFRDLQRAGLPSDLPGAYAVQEGEPADAKVQIGGDPDQQGVVVKRGVPRFLAAGSAAIPPGSSGRRELARWLTRPDHPLTARVMVNRIWQQHLGQGIVSTPSNFGLSGDAPTHPELLDWLATSFVESGWSVKELHRLILDSKTYQLASGHHASSAETDTANRWYWRYERRRLEAEPIRDAMLAVSGQLDETRPARHPFPSIDTWTWSQHRPFKAVYPSNYRSVYLMTQRIQRHPYLGLFDCPDANYSTAARTQSTVPLQALYMMNNSFVREQAEAFARRLLQTSEEAGQRIELALQLAWGRTPGPSETQQAIGYIQDYLAELERIGVQLDERERRAWSSYAHVLLTSNEFIYID